MAKKYEYTTKNVYSTKGELHSLVDAETLNQMAADGWELFEVLEGMGFKSRYVEAVFRREI